MPYKNILWIKLEHRLLNDSRYFLLSEKAQLIYVKLLMIAAQTDNKITTDLHTLKALLRTKARVTEIQSCLDKIQLNFPKFKKSLLFYYFEEWESRVNWTPKKEILGNSQELPGTPTEFPEKKRIDKIREEKKISHFLKPFFQSMPLRESDGKLWCVPKGDGKWLEFMDTNENINKIVWK